MYYYYWRLPSAKDRSIANNAATKGTITDVGHGIFAAKIHGLPALRAAAEHLDEPAATTL